MLLFRTERGAVSEGGGVETAMAVRYPAKLKNVCINEINYFITDFEEWISINIQRIYTKEMSFYLLLEDLLQHSSKFIYDLHHYTKKKCDKSFYKSSKNITIYIQRRTS